MNRLLPCLVLSMLLAGLANAGDAGDETPATVSLSSPEDLHRIVADLDARLFGAYNRCDLVAFRALLADDLEFYHDQGGVMWSPDEVVAGVKANICGKVRRELVAGTLEVDRIAGFGAVELGSHRFCEVATGKCVGIARFVQVWKFADGRWQASRIISYGHRPLPGAE
jgi:hypothetical protein